MSLESIKNPKHIISPKLVNLIKEKQQNATQQSLSFSKGTWAMNKASYIDRLDVREAPSLLLKKLYAR